MELNIQSICRLCLSEEGVMSNIFENQRNIFDSSLANCILYLFGTKIELSIDDNLPKLICHKCNYLVEQSFKFHKDVEKTYTFLCNHIKDTTIEEAIEQQEDFIIDTPVILDEEEEVDCYEDYEFLDNAFQIKENSDVIDECPICLENCGDNIFEHLKNHDQHQEWGSFFKHSEFFQQYICKLCDIHKVIKRRYEFIIHIRRHLKIKPYKCTDCDNSSFYSSNLLKIHISKGHCNMNCLTCSEIFTDKNDFNDHIKNVHKKNQEKNYSCSNCDKNFTTMTNLKMHQRSHTEVGKFKCTMCEKFYHRKSDLTRHLNVHLGKKSFKCTQCETACFTQPELNRHMIYHSSIRSFQCNFCDKSFYESGHLTLHQKTIHFKIKEFPCEFCQKDFPTSHKLKRHQMAKSCKGNKQQEENNIEIINFIGNDQNLPMQILVNDDLHEFTINNFDGISMEINSDGINDNLNMTSDYGQVMDYNKKINVIELRNVNDEIQNYLLVEESMEDNNSPFVFNGNENI